MADSTVRTSFCSSLQTMLSSTRHNAAFVAAVHTIATNVAAHHAQQTAVSRDPLPAFPVDPIVVGDSAAKCVRVHLSDLAVCPVALLAADRPCLYFGFGSGHYSFVLEIRLDNSRKNCSSLLWLCCFRSLNFATGIRLLEEGLLAAGNLCSGVAERSPPSHSRRMLGMPRVGVR